MEAIIRQRETQEIINSTGDNTSDTGQSSDEARHAVASTSSTLLTMPIGHLNHSANANEHPLVSLGNAAYLFQAGMDMSALSEEALAQHQQLLMAAAAAAMPERPRKKRRLGAKFPQPLSLMQGMNIHLSMSGDAAADGAALAAMESNVANPLHQWLSTTELRQLEQERGVLVRRGRFTAAEDDRLHQAVQAYLTERDLLPNDLPILMSKKRLPGCTIDDRHRKDFWPTIAVHFPDRPLVSLYHRVRRLFTPAERSGAWTDEEIQHMISLVEQYGRDWQRIGQQLGRLPENCRSRYKLLRNDYRFPNGEFLENAPRRVRWCAEDLREFVYCVLDIILNTMERPGNVEQQTLTVGELIAILDRRGLPWIAISEKYCSLPVTVPRNDNFLRNKWYMVSPMIRRNLDAAVSEQNLPVHHLITYEDVFILSVARNLTRLWTRDDDLTLIQRLIQLFPHAQVDSDVNWTETAAGPLSRYTPQTVNGRFRFLVDVANVNTNQPLTNVFVLMLEYFSNISPEDHQTICSQASRRTRPHRVRAADGSIPEELVDAGHLEESELREQEIILSDPYVHDSDDEEIPMAAPSTSNQENQLPLENVNEPEENEDTIVSQPKKKKSKKSKRRS